MEAQQAPKETNEQRMERLPKVILAYAHDVRKNIPLDSDAWGCLVFSASTIATLLVANAGLKAALKEVSGCHEQHNTPKLCEGCRMAIEKAINKEY